MMHPVTAVELLIILVLILAYMIILVQYMGPAVNHELVLMNNVIVDVLTEISLSLPQFQLWSVGQILYVLWFIKAKTNALKV